MFGGIEFFLYKNKIDLCGEVFPVGQLTADLLNCGEEECVELWNMIESVEEQAHTYQDTQDRNVWFQLNEQMEELSHRLRKWKIFQLLIKNLEDDQIFSEARELVQNYSLFPDEDYNLGTPEGEFTEVVQRWLRAKQNDWQYEEELDRVLDWGREERAAQEDKDLPKPQVMLVYPGKMKDKWQYYMFVVERYKAYLSDMIVFIPTIHNFLHFMLDHLEVNSPENYARELYILYNDDRLREKLMPMSLGKHAVFQPADKVELSFVPGEMKNGLFTIAQKYESSSLQLLLKADFMTSLNAGYKIHRCRVCKRYFLVQGGYHVQYCEGQCPYAPRFTCRQFGSYRMEKELARDIPKMDVKIKAIQRISKDLQRGNITEKDAERAKRYVTDTLYEVLNLPAVSVEEFREMVSAAEVYQACGITRKAKPRGRPEKKKEEAHEQ